MKKALDQNNQYKKITTKNGSTITFEDNAQGEGTKDKITIQTAKESHTILMDNENNKIVVKDKENKNFIEMKTQTGHMTIQAEKKLTLFRIPYFQERSAQHNSAICFRNLQ